MVAPIVTLCPAKIRKGPVGGRAGDKRGNPGIVLHLEGAGRQADSPDCARRQAWVISSFEPSATGRLGKPALRNAGFRTGEPTPHLGGILNSNNRPQDAIEEVKRSRIGWHAWAEESPHREGIRQSICPASRRTLRARREPSHAVFWIVPAKRNDPGRAGEGRSPVAHRKGSSPRVSR